MSGNQWHIGVQEPLTAFNWFKSYLTGRSQKCVIREHELKETGISCGVPQGSLLGVLLFQLQINDMRTSLKFCDAILYADDTTVFVIGRNLRAIKAKMQADLDSLSRWLSVNKLLIKCTKNKKRTLL